MKQVIEGLIRLADYLDKKGLAKEADLADKALQVLKANLQPPAEEEAEEAEEENMLEKSGDEAEEECAPDASMMPMKAMEEKAVLRRKARREKLLAKIG